MKVSEPDLFTFEALYDLMVSAGGDRPLEESIKWNQLMFHRGKENLVALIPQKNRINLQIFNGKYLADPSGLLEGTGKDARHVKCPSSAFVEEHKTALLALMKNAIEVGLSP